MKKSKLIIVGTRGHSKVVADAVASSNSYDIVGCLDDFKEKNSHHFGRKILGSIKEINSVIINGSKTSFFIAIGDNLRTDIKGAINMNYDSLFITGGIHNKEVKNLGIDDVLKKYKVETTYYQSALKW